MKTKQTDQPRRGAAAILILLLTTLMFVAIVFSIDIARIQLAQMELQSGVDLAARAGAESLARGVGEGMDNATVDAMIRDEVNMIAQLNSASGNPIVLDSSSIAFGQATLQSDGSYAVANLGSFNGQTDSVVVKGKLPSFPVVFGGFVSQESVNLTESAASMVRERDIVVVIDRSGSMLTHDSGNYPVSEYLPNLRTLEDGIYETGEAYYPGGPNASASRHTEFEEASGQLNLSRIQALKLAVLKFRQEIDASRSREYLGMTSYSDFADTPAQSYKATKNVNIVTGLSNSMYDRMVGNGITTGNERYASALESESTNYRSFDYNYLAMRRRSMTNICDGLVKGADVLFGVGHRQFATPVMILMTDGIHNQAGDPLSTATNLMAAHPEMKIYTVTFGNGADQTTMKNIATVGRGEHFHATSATQLVDIFKKLANSAGVTLIQ